MFFFIRPPMVWPWLHDVILGRLELPIQLSQKKMGKSLSATRKTHLWVNHHQKNFSTWSSHPSIFAKDLSLGIAIHLVLLSSSTATSVLVLKPQSMHLKTLGSYVQVAWSIADLGLAARFPPTKMSYILVVKSHLHPGVFIMAVWHFPRYTHFYLLVGFMTGFFMGNFRIRINLGVLLPNLIHKMS